jgi:hypothetical protein
MFRVVIGAILNLADVDWKLVSNSLQHWRKRRRCQQKPDDLSFWRPSMSARNRMRKRLDSDAGMRLFPINASPGSEHWLNDRGET